MSEEKIAPGISTGSRHSKATDWRDPESYKPLLDLDRAGWAWEWIRRSPGFRASVKSQPDEKRVTADNQPRLIAAPAMQTLKRWGLIFRRKFRPRDFLVPRLQSVRAAGRSPAAVIRSNRFGQPRRL